MAIFISPCTIQTLFASDLLATQSQAMHKGIWVTVFSEKNVLYSKDAVEDLVETCKKAGIDEIYLQVFRAGEAYYDSHISDRTKYETIIEEAGTDTIDLLLREAGKNNIKVFAWVNMLSLAQNKKAPILKRFGDEVLTKDQYMRPSIRNEDVDESDKYYLRDDQLFLEPGDPRVSRYLISIVDEIINRYPSISGIHLDYIRYPYPVPFIPDSRFNNYGIAYGYGQKNIQRFKEKTNFSPLDIKHNDKIGFKWDNWKRNQVTMLVEKISAHIKAKSKNYLVSCAVTPSPVRAYSVAFQDWSFWLEKGIVDYVVLMDYTKDDRLSEVIIRAALSQGSKEKIFVGIGAFMLKDDIKDFIEQYHVVNSLNPGGVVIFSYDDLSDKLLRSLKAAK